MKISTYKMDLAAGLNKLVKIIGGKTVMGILNNVKIVAEKNKVELIGTNLDLIGIVTLDNATIEEEGSTLLDYKILHTFIKKAKSDIITIENSSDKATVTSDKVNFKINSFDAMDYPLLPNLEFKEIQLTNEEFKKAIDNTGYSIGISDSRPILKAINIKANSNGLKFVSTDSHRLGYYKLELNSDIEELEVNPVGTGLNLALKLLDKKNKSNVKMKFNNVYTVLQFDNMELYVKNIEGNYPETDRLIPDTFKTEIELCKNELLELLPQLSIFSKNEANNAIQLNFENNNVELSFTSKDVGSISSNVKMFDGYGDNLVITFSLIYLEEALKALESNTVRFKFNGKMRPFTIEGDQKGEKHLVLPIRTY